MSDLGLTVQIGARFVLAGAMLSAISSVLNVIALDRKNRVIWVSLAWATLVLAHVTARLVAFHTDAAFTVTARIQYSAIFLHLPLALLLVAPRDKLAIGMTTAVGLLPLLTPGFVTDTVVVRADALSVPIRYPLPGHLVAWLVPYAVVAAARVVHAAWRNPDLDPFIRKLLVVAAVVEIPAGTNDLLMTEGVITSVLMADAASCTAVAGLMLVLARRSTVAYAELVHALDEQSRALRRGAHETRVAQKLAEIGAVVERTLGRIGEPLRELSTHVSGVDATIRGLVARRDDETLRETSLLSQEAVDAVRRMEGTVRVLSDFARAQETVREPCSVWDLVERALRIVQNDLVHRARVVTQLGTAPTVLADKARLVEVFVHLLQSAAASIPSARWDSARLTVSLSTDADGNAAVRVADDGDPVPQDALPRLFDPYATSGGRADGSAFRLSICHRIVTSVGGRIGVESSSAGTVVTVTLPAAPT